MVVWSATERMAALDELVRSFPAGTDPYEMAEVTLRVLVEEGDQAVEFLVTSLLCEAIIEHSRPS